LTSVVAGRRLRVAHFEAPYRDRSEISAKLSRGLYSREADARLKCGWIQLTGTTVHWKIETLGNASLLVLDGERPVLLTDPWLEGTAYFGSWALEHPLTELQLARAAACPFIWISHGHPDHLHIPSLARLRRDCEILLPDHYYPELKHAVEAEGFRTRILPFKTWTTLEDGVRIMCVQNENMDAILAVEVAGALVLNKNDSPFCGEDPFFQRLVRKYEKSYLLALCAFDADMLNLYDESMRFSAGPPEARKPGTIWATSRICDYLGVKNFCCSSSQHIYVRQDSAWANAYRISWPDIKKYWCARATRLIEPFVTIDLESGEVVPNNPAQQPDLTRVTVTTGDDDWSESATEADWTNIEGFVHKFQTLQKHTDFVGFVVAGEERRFMLSSACARQAATIQRGVIFHVPRHSLMKTIEYGYFDDLLIGNFMKTQLRNMALYPHFTPTIAKLGGNAKVYTSSDLRQFRHHFFRLSPVAFIRYRIGLWAKYILTPSIKSVARSLGVFELLKRLRRRLVGMPEIS
jgi:hypothetical protein